MRAAFAVAALAGAAIAAPSYGQPGKEVKYVEHVEVDTVVVTVYVTEGYEVPQATSSAAPVYQAPASSTVVTEQHHYQPSPKPQPSSKYEAPAYTPAPQPQPTPTPTPTPSPQPAPPANQGYMAVVDEWRSKMGLSALTQDSKLEANAKDTVVSSNGQMIHKLNPGSFAQVLAPGSMDNTADFTHVFVGGWLCEVPSTPGLGDAVCNEQSKGWNYAGQDGHNKILTGSYKSIGCAEAAGIVCCDLA